MPGENTDPKPNNVIRPVLGRKTSCINSKLTAEENCGATQRIRMFQKSYSERNHAASVSMEQSAIQVGQHVDPIKGSQNAREIKDTPPSLPSKRTLNPAPKLVRSGSIKNVASLFENGKNSENSNSPTKSIQPDLADLQVSGKVSRSKLDLEQIATNPSVIAIAST